jgi:hypothetical protein
MASARKARWSSIQPNDFNLLAAQLADGSARMTHGTLVEFPVP